jgi:hypothetical protein
LIQRGHCALDAAAVLISFAVQYHVRLITSAFLSCVALVVVLMMFVSFFYLIALIANLTLVFSPARSSPQKVQSHWFHKGIECFDESTKMYIHRNILIIRIVFAAMWSVTNPTRLDGSVDRIRYFFFFTSVFFKTLVLPNRSMGWQGKLQWLCSACGACLDSGKCCPHCEQIYRQGL